MARILSERAGLGLHSDPATKLVIELVPHLDDAADVTTRDIGQAEQAINAIETVWNAPPQPTRAVLNSIEIAHFECALGFERRDR